MDGCLWPKPLPSRLPGDGDGCTRTLCRAMPPPPPPPVRFSALLGTMMHAQAMPGTALLCRLRRHCALPELRAHPAVPPRSRCRR